MNHIFTSGFFEFLSDKRDNATPGLRQALKTLLCEAWALDCEVESFDEQGRFKIVISGMVNRESEVAECKNTEK